VARDEMKPAYLITGGDEGKTAAALRRLRARAEREGGPGALESFSSAGQGGPDVDGLVAAIPAMSLTAERRYLVAEGIERATTAQARALTGALEKLPPDVTVVLVERRAARGKPDATALAKAVKKAGGEVLVYEAPTARELPARLVADARERGFRLESAAARLLVERMGPGMVRLANELDRLATWAGESGEVALADLEAMIADTSEEATWTLSDSLVARDAASALGAAERLSSQGEAVTPIVYQAAKRLREAHEAVTMLEAGRPQREVEGSLGMHPYAAKMLVRRVQGTTPRELRDAICAIADLEWWTRGGSDYPDDAALTLAVLRAAGAGT
jgi:DNA polymerase III delta subunit